MADGMQMEPSALTALAHRLGSTGDALDRAVFDASGVRFGPDAVAPDLRAHGVAYAAGMRDLGAVVDAMARSVADLSERLDAAAAAAESTDGDAATVIRAGGGWS